MRRLMAVLIMVSCHYSHAQEDKVFTKVEMGPQADLPKLTRYVKMNVELPDSVAAKIPPGTYQAVVEFVIDTHGYMGQWKLIKDPGHGLGNRALNIMRNYQGKWQPASQCGRFVSAYLKQPVVFVIR
jgi:hypothetical protein